VTLPDDRIVLNVFVRDDGRGGNPATVVRLDRDPGTRALAAMAREAGTPACAFLLPGSPPRARFFTATSELSFCGHGALAAGFAEAERQGSSLVALETGGRTLRIERGTGALAFLILAAAGTVAPEPDPAAVCAALGIGPGELDEGAITVASAGSAKWLVRLRSREALRALDPEMGTLARISAEAGVNGAYVYVEGKEAEPADILARGFNPAGGVAEDAATGSAAAALAWSLREALEGRWLAIDQGLGLETLNRIRVRVLDDWIHLGGRIEPAAETGSAADAASAEERRSPPAQPFERVQGVEG
jgi:PhzF family phenazine biosynthesis protein